MQSLFKKREPKYTPENPAPNSYVEFLKFKVEYERLTGRYIEPNAKEHGAAFRLFMAGLTADEALFHLQSTGFFQPENE